MYFWGKKKRVPAALSRNAAKGSSTFDLPLEKRVEACQVDIRDQVQRLGGRNECGQLEPSPHQPSPSEGRGSIVY